jgi:hypothetical protein
MKDRAKATHCNRMWVHPVKLAQRGYVGHLVATMKPSQRRPPRLGPAVKFGLPLVFFCVAGYGALTLVSV